MVALLGRLIGLVIMYGSDFNDSAELPGQQPAL